jgi:predicted nucleic acid-binding protein
VKAGAYGRERTQEKLVGLCHSGLELAEFFDEAGRLVRRVVAFDGFCSLSLDPATLLPTSHFTHDSMRPEDVPRLAGHRQVTDAHLLTLARRRGMRLVTFDAAIVALSGERSDVELLATAPPTAPP